MYAIGLMSGTSLDGVDACLVNITETDNRTQYNLIDFITKPFSERIFDEIKKSISLDYSNVKLICSLNFKLGYEFAEAAKLVCAKAKIPMSEICFIASHGQTIWHQPLNEEGYIKSTLQIGEAAVISYETNCQVISNFRVMDMASGGQGAPLVSFTDYLLYRNDELNVIVQNIGGIGNLTYLPKACSPEDVISFDTGPGNMMIDYLMQKYYQKPYDVDGKIARTGNLHIPLLRELLSHPFIKIKPPKTTGREMFGASFIESIVKKYNQIPVPDLITTFTHFVALSIAENYKKFIKNYDLVIVSGGGSYNDYMIELLKCNLNCDVKRLEELGENGEAKEAIAFAILGYYTLKGKPNNLKSATGASNYVILGQITPKPRDGVIKYD